MGKDREYVPVEDDLQEKEIMGWTCLQRQIMKGKVEEEGKNKNNTE